MDLRRRIAKATIGGEGCSFTLEVLSWADELSPETECERLLVGIEVLTPGGMWRSSAVSVMRDGISEVATAAGPRARRRGRGSGTIRYAYCEHEPAVVFCFRFLPEDGKVEVTLELDKGFAVDAPACRADRPDSVLLRVSPAESAAFADALEAIAAKEPERMAWAG